MTRRRRNPDLDAYRTPSAVALRALQHPGAGKHTESKEKRNQRTGRLKGAEKRRFRNGDYE